jgi:hypothetical protein
MKTIFLASVVMVMTTTAYAVTPAQKGTQTHCLIQGDGLNIRKTPDLNGDVVATLERSDTVIRHQVVTVRIPGIADRRSD